jgi:hypothetical protein
MLKIPLSSDRPPPLVAPLSKPTVAELRLAEIPPPRGKHRRTKKSRQSASHVWDQSTGQVSRTRRGERRQMLWMLIGGAVLFLLILAGVLLTMSGGEPPPPVLVKSPTVKSPAPPSATEAAAPLSDAAFLAEAEPLARKFLEARRIEDLLPLVRNPDQAAARMRRCYSDGKITPPGMTGFNTTSEISRSGAISNLMVRTRDYEDKPLSFAATPQGIKIDWESWVGWADMSWEQFLESKPTTARVFRLSLSAVDYYNFDFSDDGKWQAYRLESPDGAHAIYGYVERGSLVSATIHPPADSEFMRMTLALKFPNNPTSGNQVLIEKFIAEGWALENEPAP